MKRVCELLGTKKVNTTGYHPRTDGMVERMNRTLIGMIAKHTEFLWGSVGSLSGLPPVRLSSEDPQFDWGSPLSMKETRVSDRNGIAGTSVIRRARYRRLQD